MDSKKYKEINEYANCMFRFEKLPEKWIDSCTAYLQHIFQNTVQGKVVIDYAFGRGNWSLSFLRAGASKVFAIDASIDNVLRFKEYCKEFKIKNIEIIQGNILSDNFTTNGDIIWLYGILHHIREIDYFLENIKLLARNNESIFYIYYYNKGCLREFVIEWCRKYLTYSNEDDFLNDIVLFLRPARLRARDDLTAPYINWLTGNDLKDLLRNHGIFIKQVGIDFNEFLSGSPSEEFYPHHFLCTLYPEKEIAILEPDNLFKNEIAILNEFASFVFTHCNQSEKKKTAIGLFNTHFAFLKNGYNAKESLLEIFLFLANILLLNKIKYQIKYSDNIETYLTLIKAALADIHREQYKKLIGENHFTNYLCEHRIRI